MMTEAMRPLGLSLWQKTTPAPMTDCASRLFVDVTARLADPSARTGLFDTLGKSDPLIRDALEGLVADAASESFTDASASSQPLWHRGAPLLDPDPTIVDDLVTTWQESLQTLRRQIGSKFGPELFEFIDDDIVELRGLLFDQRSLQVIMTAIDATWWLQDHLDTWLGEPDAAGVLTLAAPNNITSQMGLALLDVADAIRPHPAVVAYLQRVRDEHLDDRLLDTIGEFPGGTQPRAALQNFLSDFGARCIGEIDITQPRWSERPTALVPVLLSHIHHAEPGEAQRRFQQGQDQAAAKQREILDRLATLSAETADVAETPAMIERVRTFIGYREYPKYAWMCRFYEYKLALLREARQLVSLGTINAVDDIFYLTFDELRTAVRDQAVDPDVIAERRAAFEIHRTLTPPRVITSDGEMLNGHYRRDDLPVGALAGLGVSAGTVEGRARVITDMAQADIEPGDIIVTPHTDPSWSPLFVSIGGLVTEVGGAMTHGAVVAREYGLPAVVGVKNATNTIPDGQRIRLNGTDGYVEILTP